MEYPGNVAIESYLKDKNLYDKVDQAKLAKGWQYLILCPMSSPVWQAAIEIIGTYNYDIIYKLEIDNMDVSHRYNILLVSPAGDANVKEFLDKNHIEY